MKTLFLVRHAKAGTGEADHLDRDRPLTGHGEAQAAHMGERLAGRGVRAQWLLSSPAARALATARLVAGKIGHDTGSIAVDECLYEARMSTVLERVRRLDDALDTVVLFGHNPAFAELANRLSPTISRMPTAAVAGFTFDVGSWSEVGRVAPATVSFDCPGET